MDGVHHSSGKLIPFFNSILRTRKAPGPFPESGNTAVKRQVSALRRGGTREWMEQEHLVDRITDLHSAILRAGEAGTQGWSSEGTWSWPRSLALTLLEDGLPPHLA
jgi:hypothetical protein